jgi:hypothetical protein
MHYRVDLVEEKTVAEQRAAAKEEGELVFQRKVVPWEAMMQMDMDLSQGREDQVKVRR